MVAAFVKEVRQHLVYDGTFGTKERTCAVPAICDVTDMKNVLEKYVKMVSLDSAFDRYYPGRSKLGDMHVYSDGRIIEFNESSPISSPATHKTTTRKNLLKSIWERFRPF